MADTPHTPETEEYGISSFIYKYASPICDFTPINEQQADLMVSVFQQNWKKNPGCESLPYSSRYPMVQGSSFP